MRLFLHIDADWPETDATPVELDAVVRPTTTLRGLHPLDAHLGLVFASGADPSRLSLDAITVAVRCLRAKVPVVTVRARDGDIVSRVDALTRSDDLEHDLGEVRATLLALHRACPKLQPAILVAGRAVTEALRQRNALSGAGAITAAWSAVETLRIEQPRIAPWLVTPDRLLASWAAHLG